MQRRSFLIGLAGLVALPAVRAASAPNAVAATQDHWLVGTWIGSIEHLPSKASKAPVMIVKLVQGENVDLRYGYPDSRGTSAIRGTLRDEELRLKTPGPAGSDTLIVRRDGDDVLTGTYFVTASGATYPVTFHRA